jgi:mono/diheme cytochrome c family protein
MKLSNLLTPILALSLGLASCGGDSKKTEGEPSNDNSQAAAPSGDATHGQQVYAQTCTPCHGATGKGDGAAAATLNPKPADHTNKAVIGARSDQDLANIIKMGGGVVGKPTMPASPQLSDNDVKDVIAYLRQLSGTDHH